jgi:hypothetical protein
MGNKLPTPLHCAPRFRISRATHRPSYLPPSTHRHNSTFHIQYFHIFQHCTHKRSCFWCDCGDKELQNLFFLPFLFQYYQYDCIQLASSVCCVNKVWHMPNTSQMKIYLQTLLVKPSLFHMPFFSAHLSHLYANKHDGGSAVTQV